MTTPARFGVGAGLALLVACSANDGTPIEELRERAVPGDSGSGGEGPVGGSKSNGGTNSGGKASGGTNSGGKASAGSAGAAAGGGGSGGTAGTSAGGGQAGNGGSAPGPCGNLIDDFEDQNGFGCVGNGRNGQWFGFNDGGTATPVGNAIMPAALERPPGSQFAMRFAGVSTTIAGIGTSIARVGDQAIDYDATLFTGVEFYAMATPAITLSFEIQTADTDLVMYGGTCESACASNKLSVAVPAQWEKLQVPFQNLTGGSSPLDPAKIRSINFVVTGGFELWIDDVAFY